MKFEATAIPGVYIVHLELISDNRGFFARAWCEMEFKKINLVNSVSQCNMSYNYRAGTLRGLHMQLPPNAESKLVRCIRGAIFDVAVDMRMNSPTFCSWFGTRLDQHNRTLLYIPKGCAHGYLTLEADSEIFYQVSSSYSPENEISFRWDDPAFGIKWPMAVHMISEKDNSTSFFKEDEWQGLLKRKNIDFCL